MNDIKLSSTLNLSDKIITLDFNGHTLTGNITLADNSASPQSILTLIAEATVPQAIFTSTAAR